MCSSYSLNSLPFQGGEAKAGMFTAGAPSPYPSHQREGRLYVFLSTMISLPYIKFHLKDAPPISTYWDEIFILKNGLHRFSRRSVVSGPWPGSKRARSGSGIIRVRIESIRAWYDPPGRSVLPTESSKTVSPLKSTGGSSPFPSYQRQMLPAEWPGV